MMIDDINNPGSLDKDEQLAVLKQFKTSLELLFDSKNKNMSLVKVQSWFFPLMILLIGISNILVIYIGGNQYMRFNRYIFWGF